MKSRRFKTLYRLLRRPFEWLAIFAAMAILSRLSHRCLFRAADFVGALAYRVDRRGRKLSLVNLRAILNPRDEAVREDGRYNPSPREEKIIRGAYRNMARTAAHVFWTSRKARGRVAEVARADAAAERVLADHHPLITVSAHLGCWEILSQLVFVRGHKMMSVAKDIGSPAMTRLLMRSRQSVGQQIVHANGAFRHLMQALKSGVDVGLLVDQVVKPSEGGLWVRFFGRPVPVSAAPAFLCAKTHVPIAIAWSRPLKDGAYRCELIGFIEWANGFDVWETTQRCISMLERTIRRHPSRWVLNYRYFRKHPDEKSLAQLLKREARRR